MTMSSSPDSFRHPGRWRTLYSAKTDLATPPTTPVLRFESPNLILRAHLATNECLVGRNPTRSGVPLSGLTSIAACSSRIPMLGLRRWRYRYLFRALESLSPFTSGQVKVFISIGPWLKWWTVRPGNATQRVSSVCVNCTVWRLGPSELRIYRASFEHRVRTTEKARPS